MQTKIDDKNSKSIELVDKMFVKLNVGGND